MDNIQTVKDRLIEFLKAKKITQKKFEESIEASNGYVNAMRKGMGVDKIELVRSKYPELNIKWLLTGEGEMLNTNNTNASGETLVNEDSENIKSYEVPLLPISAQGGSLNDFSTSVNTIDCEKIISPIKNISFAITVAGDSMAPEYPSGSHILIKKINQDTFIEWGKVYVLDTCNGIIIKRLTTSDKHGYLKCLSDNNPSLYAPFDISTDDIYGIYKVMLCMSIK